MTIRHGLDPNDLARRVGELILALDRDVDGAVAAGGLPIFEDMGGWAVLRSSGDVVSYDRETSEVVPCDAQWTVITYVLAERRFPELAGLRPNRPGSAEECPKCGGSGAAVDALESQGVITPEEAAELSREILCECLGLGWVDPERN